MKFKKTVALTLSLFLVVLNSSIAYHIKVQDLKVLGASKRFEENQEALLKQYEELDDNFKSQVFIELFIDYVESLKNFVELFERNSSYEEIINKRDEFVFNFIHFSNVLEAIYEKHKFSEPIKDAFSLFELHKELAIVSNFPDILCRDKFSDQKETTASIHYFVLQTKPLVSFLEKIKLELDEGKSVKDVDQKIKFSENYKEIRTLEENPKLKSISNPKLIYLQPDKKDIADFLKRRENFKSELVNICNHLTRFTSDFAELNLGSTSGYKLINWPYFFIEKFLQVKKIFSESGDQKYADLLEKIQNLVDSITKFYSDILRNKEIFKSSKNFSSSLEEIKNDVVLFSQKVENFIKKEKTQEEINFDTISSKIQNITVLLAVEARKRAAKGCNWMGAVPDSTPIYEMSVPATHDTITYLKAKNFTVYNWKSQCQSYTIYQQLELGVRDFDLRMNSKNQLIHGNVIYKGDFIEDVIKPCVNFIKKYPSEVFVLGGIENGTRNSELLKYFSKNPEAKKLFDGVSINEKTTIGEIRGKILTGGFGPRESSFPGAGEWQGPVPKDKFDKLRTHIERASKETQPGLWWSTSVAATAGVETVKKFFQTLFGSRKLTPKSYASFLNPRVAGYIKGNNVFKKVGRLRFDFVGSNTKKQEELNPKVVWEVNFRT